MNRRSTDHALDRRGIGDEIGVDWDRSTRSSSAPAWTSGTNTAVMTLKTDVTGDDPVMTGKIAPLHT